MNLLPKAFIERMQQRLGNDLPSYIRALSVEPPVSIRLNPSKLDAGFSKSIKLSYSDYAYVLTERPRFNLDPLFHAGCYYVQEAGSIFLEHIFKQLQLPSDPFILDLCAAPGGKSTHLLSLLNNQGLLVSNEIIPSRNKILQQNIYKWGYENVIVTQAAAARIAASDLACDLVLIDAPCSGEGLFRKDKEAGSHWSEAAVQGCSRRQQDLVESIIPSIKQGGYLIYSTCTFEESENDDIIQYLVKHHGFEVVQITSIPEGVISTNYGFQFYPHRTYSEGFYISALRKTTLTHKEKFNYPLPASYLIESTTSLWNPFIDTYRHQTLRLHDTYFLINEIVAQALNSLGGVTIKSAGAPLGKQSPKLKPHAALALSNRLHYAQAIKLNHSDALKFLSGNALENDNQTHGLLLLTYQQHGLGWVNAVKGRLNNLYPHEWRITYRQ